MAAAPETTAALSELIAVVAQLRNPEGGCPWDLEQTHAMTPISKKNWATCSCRWCCMRRLPKKSGGSI